jgi:beta-phosphoglucomutase-like phosphatase (HAD superfamily)
MPREVGRALLFDIDGTLADIDALHLEAFNKVFSPRAMSSITHASRKSFKAFPMPRSVSGFWRMNRQSVNRTS